MPHMTEEWHMFIFCAAVAAYLAVIVIVFIL